MPPALLCHGGHSLHHIELNLKGQQQAGTAWGTRYPISFACLKASSLIHVRLPACIVKTPSLLDQVVLSHPAVVMMPELREYRSTYGRRALTPKRRYLRKGPYYGTETPSSRWASHPELPPESWLRRRQDRGAGM